MNIISDIYQRLITLLADVPIATLPPMLWAFYNLATIAFFIFLLRLLSLTLSSPPNYARWSWGLLLGLFGLGRAMTTMQLVFQKNLIISLEVSVMTGISIFIITYCCVPFVAKVGRIVLR